MLGIARHFVRPARSALLLATAFAILLPLPARCVACSTAKTNCPKCAAAHVDQEPATLQRSCCQHRLDLRQHAELGQSVSQHRSYCGCDLRPVHRTVPAKDQLPTAQDYAVLAAMPFDSATMLPQATTAAFLRGELPPPIPHRIMHCSWVL